MADCGAGGAGCVHLRDELVSFRVQSCTVAPRACLNRVKRRDRSASDAGLCFLAHREGQRLPPFLRRSRSISRRAFATVVALPQVGAVFDARRRLGLRYVLGDVAEEGGCGHVLDVHVGAPGEQPQWNVRRDALILLELGAIHLSIRLVVELDLHRLPVRPRRVPQACAASGRGP